MIKAAFAMCLLVGVTAGCGGDRSVEELKEASMSDMSCSELETMAEYWADVGRSYDPGAEMPGIGGDAAAGAAIGAHARSRDFYMEIADRGC